MASLSQIRDGIKTTLTANITNLEVYDTVPDVAITPAVLVWLDSIDFNVAMGRGTDRYEFDLFVLASRAVADEGQDSVDEYITGVGARSVRQVVFQNRTLGLAGTDAHVSAMPPGNYGGKFDIAQIPHIGAVLRLVVVTPGTS